MDPAFCNEYDALLEFRWTSVFYEVTNVSPFVIKSKPTLIVSRICSYTVREAMVPDESYPPAK